MKLSDFFVFRGGMIIFAIKMIHTMKKFIFALLCAAAVLVCGCNKENSGNGDNPGDKVTWASLVKEYPFLSNFPTFDGEIENCQYRELSGMETVMFFDYKCEESVSTTYYAKFGPAGFTKSESSHIYRKTVGDMVYAFTGAFSGGNFALSFSADKK